MPDGNKISLGATGTNIFLKGEFRGIALARLPELKLFEEFEFTLDNHLNELELGGTLSVAKAVWIRRGPFWFASALDLGASFTTASGASGSIQLDSGLYYKPLLNLTLSLKLFVKGEVDRDGFRGDVGIKGLGIDGTTTKGLLFEARF